MLRLTFIPVILAPLALLPDGVQLAAEHGAAQDELGDAEGQGEDQDDYRDCPADPRIRDRVADLVEEGEGLDAREGEGHAPHNIEAGEGHDEGNDPQDRDEEAVQAAYRDPAEQGYAEGPGYAHPVLASVVTMTDEKKIVEPMDMSIPPDTMTNTSPAAAIPVEAVCWSRLTALAPLKNYG